MTRAEIIESVTYTTNASGNPIDPPYIAWRELSDEDLAQVIRETDTWDISIEDGSLEEFISRAGMSDEWNAERSEFERIADAAAEKLGVEIY